MAGRGRGGDGFRGLARLAETRGAAAAWLVIVAAALLWVCFNLWRGYEFDSRILALLPESRQELGGDRELAGFVDRRLSELASRQLVFLVGHAERGGSARAAEGFARSLRDSGHFDAVRGRVDGDRARQWRDSFFPYRYGLLTGEARRQLQQEPVDSQHPLLQQALARLYSPLSSAVSPTLEEDPLQLFFLWQLQANPAGDFSVRDNWLSREHEGHTWRLITATLAADPYQLDYQQALMDSVASARQGLPADAQLLRSGLVIHAAHGADQARGEMSTIGVGSILGISALLIFCFRSVRPLALALLPIGVGWLFALAVALAVFPRLHLVTLAFGASLIGVAVDYAFHYLTAREGSRGRSGGRDPALRAILPAVTLGLVSSGLAYGAQGAAPFPGLRQMALFSVAGLLGAWLTVILWLPRLAVQWRRSRSLPLHRLAARLGGLLDRWPAPSRPAWLLALMGLSAAAFAVWGPAVDDSLDALQTSPPSLLQEEAAVSELTGSPDPNRYFLLSASGPQTLLEREEELRGRLRPLVANGALQGVQATSQWLPSARRQARNRALLAETVYAPEGLVDSLAGSLGSADLAASMRRQFRQSGEAVLRPEHWQASPASQGLDFLWLGEHGGRYHSLLLPVKPRDGVEAKLNEMAAGSDNLYFVDKVGDIEAVLHEHRRQLQGWILLAYGAVLLVLWPRFGADAWRIAAVPACASLVSFAILGALGATINIFNMLALLLVLGLGLDAGIFLWEARRRDAWNHDDPSSRHRDYSWTAITLATLTTTLAFGLLSLSDTPVLKHFGSTLLVGVLVTWCLTPVFLGGIRPVADSGTNHKNRSRYA